MRTNYIAFISTTIAVILVRILRLSGWSFLGFHVRPVCS